MPDSQRLSNGGSGVFEVGAHVSAISLQDATQQGDRQIDGTFGLNWYPDRDFRLMIDYVHAQAEPVARSPGVAEGADSNSIVRQLRFAW